MSAHAKVLPAQRPRRVRAGRSPLVDLDELLTAEVVPCLQPERLAAGGVPGGHPSALSPVPSQETSYAGGPRRLMPTHARGCIPGRGRLPWKRELLRPSWAVRGTPTTLASPMRDPRVRSVLGDLAGRPKVPGRSSAIGDGPAPGET